MGERSRWRNDDRGGKGTAGGHACAVHPVSTALLLLGYGLALPIALRMTQIVARQHRIAFVGHQLGVGIALLGWALRGSIVIAVIHAAWLIGVRIWFKMGEPETRPSSRSA